MGWCLNADQIFFKLVPVLRSVPVVSVSFLGGLVMVLLGPIGPVIAAKKPVMRVLVFQGKQLKVRSDGKRPLLVTGLTSAEKKMNSLEVREQNGRLNLKSKVSRNVRSWRTIPRTAKIKIRSNDPRGIWLGNRRYRGQLQVVFNDNGLQVVNYVGLEKYLASVVGSEMPKSWPEAALQAQAVAARTYALRKQRNAGSYDIKSTAESQVYLGIESETLSTNNAVKNTRSLVLAYQGKLINAVFHSSSGGLTERSGYVWSKQLPYLVSVSDYDQISPTYLWDKKFRPNELKASFPEIGGVRNIELLGISPTGRILRAKVNGPRGAFFVTGKELRRRLDLKSTLVRFKMVNPYVFKKDPSKYFSTASNYLSTPTKSPSSVSRKSLGFWRDWSKGGESIFDPRVPELIAPPSLQSSSLKSNFGSTKFKINPPPAISPSFQNTVLLARGFGSGHGVGMSQWGARGLAQNGLKFDQILKHYYKGVEIIRYQRLY